MKIVRFKNGMYAIRRGNWLFGYEYKDLFHNTFWWNKDYISYFKDCLTEDLSILETILDKGVPIE